ncbi:hypothetical protein R1flu_019714 [Riccia fluitans]|uniref:Transmembrane protein n=1 Tax=Riccia fluitans TaxID=41844 RepID=A0ABD1XEG6_9MARC
MGAPLEGRLSHAVVPSFDSPQSNREARPLQQPDLAELEGRGLENGNLLGSDHHRHCAVVADSNHSSSSERVVPSWEGDHRPRKRFNGLLPLDTLDIMREAARLLRRHSDLLTTLTAVLICPISIIVLTHVLVTHKIIDWLAVRVEMSMLEGSPATEFHTPQMKFIYQKLAEFWVTSVVSFPLAVTMDSLAKASVVYTVASTYAGLKVSFGDILHRVVPRVWFRLAMTYIFCCLLFVALGVVVILGMQLLNGVFVALNVSSVIAFALVCTIGLLCGGIFLFGRMLLNVATSACVLEDLVGFKALVRTFFLIQGRMQVGIWSYIVPASCTAFLALLFAYRVTDSNEYTEYNSSASWEGPLLVLMHSFVYLFDHIMSTVFYFTCPTFSSIDNIDSHPEFSAELAVVSLESD